MKIPLETSLIALVILIHFSDGSDQTPRKGQEPRIGSKRQDYGIPDHAVTQQQFGGYSQPSFTGGNAMFQLQRIQTQPISDGDPRSISRIQHQHTSRPRFDNNLAWPRIQGQHMQYTNRSGDDRSQPAPDHNMFLTAQETEQLLGDLNPSQHSYVKDSRYQTYMPSTNVQYPNQPLQHLTTRQMVDAADVPESSSATSKKRGGARPGAGRKPGNNVAAFHLGEVHKDPLERSHDTQVSYRGKTVLLWIYAGTETKVEQAFFEGMTRPKNTPYYQRRNFLVFLEELDGKYATVVYLEQDEKLLAVRAPKKN